MAKSTSSIASCGSSIASSSSSSASSCQGSTRSARSVIDKRKRLAANERERKRMRLLNKAYDELRRKLADAENKSKYDVLVQAKEYIQALAKICESFDNQQGKLFALNFKSETQAPEDECCISCQMYPTHPTQRGTA